MLSFVRPRVASAVAAGVFSVAAVLGSVAPAAAAAPPTTEADLIGVVSYDPANPDVGYVKARYRCSGEGSLWISVKQSADRTADEDLTVEGAGTSGAAAAWLDSHRNPVTCDGKWHTDVFTVDQLEPVWGGGDKQGELAKGEGYVQFCLFDATTGPEPLSQNEFLHVRAQD